MNCYWSPNFWLDIFIILLSDLMYERARAYSCDVWLLDTATCTTAIQYHLTCPVKCLYDRSTYARVTILINLFSFFSLFELNVAVDFISFHSLMLMMMMSINVTNSYTQHLNLIEVCLFVWISSISDKWVAIGKTKLSNHFGNDVKIGAVVYLANNMIDQTELSRIFNWIITRKWILRKIIIR